MANLYSKKVLEHFFNPQNMGELPDADVTVRVGNPICGDVMEMSLKIGTRRAGEGKGQALGGEGKELGSEVPELGSKTPPEPSSKSRALGNSPPEEEYIEDIKFKTLGCGAAIATSSIATGMVKGKTLSEAERITDEAVAEALGGLPPVKRHCSLLAAEAVIKAIKKYREKKQ